MSGAILACLRCRPGVPDVRTLRDGAVSEEDEQDMSRTVKCVVLKREAPALPRAPYPGPLGQRILANVSQEGWQQWIKHQVMLMNEYRLSPVDPKARKFLEEEMEKFIFGGGSERPKEYVSPQKQGG